MSSTEIVVFIAIAVLVAIVVVATMVSLIRHANRPPPITGADVVQGQFALAVPPNVAGPVEVWIRFDLAFPFRVSFGGKPDQRFGLVVELNVDGHKTAFGHGGYHPPGTTEFDGISRWMTSFRRGNSATPTRYTASVIVKKLPACPRTLFGAVYGVSDTVVERARMTLEKG